mmetsp:Transcript_29905/g.76847  ORF Transcript_29905/g.76847 Transcript_29905/m.76847 type:complete len:245 (-) Transcript_29905:718-1452(-)
MLEGLLRLLRHGLRGGVRDGVAHEAHLDIRRVEHLSLVCSLLLERRAAHRDTGDPAVLPVHYIVNQTGGTRTSVGESPNHSCALLDNLRSDVGRARAAEGGLRESSDLNAPPLELSLDAAQQPAAPRLGNIEQRHRTLQLPARSQRHRRRRLRPTAGVQQSLRREPLGERSVQAGGARLDLLRHRDVQPGRRSPWRPHPKPGHVSGELPRIAPSHHDLQGGRLRELRDHGPANAKFVQQRDQER